MSIDSVTGTTAVAPAPIPAPAAEELVTHKARMPHPGFLLEGGIDALAGVNGIAHASGLPESLLHLVSLRASQINGCSWCVVDHSRQVVEDGGHPQRVFAVAAWREAPYFTAAERAALEFTEVLTRLADHHDPVSDALWAELLQHFTHRQISGLLFEISAINAWNRINAAIRQPAGAR
ncbi:carboxymuconolactone decarboxylase family protein [Leucobacter iarius]|uniref:Carboxymuconolactone decarboxylase family protein n=1 Tax=Leucobacter iarius TaxID=333963 RepID=A0ABP4XQ17_9MICO